MTTRRTFLKQSGSCGAYLLALMSCMPASVRRVFQESQENERLYEEEWGWIEKLSDNVWSHIATPFEQSDFTTVCNGGFVAGKERVLAIESFQRPAGAKWLAERCKELTGRWPTDVVLTHFHGDHVSGSDGYKTNEHSPRMWVTEKTAELVKQSQQRRDSVTLLEDLSTIPASGETEIDLGGQKVKLNSTSGHTPSDVIVEVVDPNIMFCGDLFWNRLVPNFRDATPTQWAKSAAHLVRDENTLYVPGHGMMSTLEDVKLFQEFLSVMHGAAKAAHAAGKEADAAAAEYKLEGKFADWYIFANTVIPGIFNAWYRELND